MCGIVGALSFADSNFRVEQDYLVRMRDTMQHRGPDGAGCWISDDQRIGFGHRRLAIIDLSTNAAQPMPSPDGRYWITFNGEIYNHAALRRELKLRGRTTWRTDPAARRDEGVIGEGAEIDQFDQPTLGEGSFDLHESRVRIAAAAGPEECAATRDVCDIGNA
jgi:hypothetical protein